MKEMKEMKEELFRRNEYVKKFQYELFSLMQNPSNKELHKSE